MTLEQQFKGAMRVSTPLVVIRSADPHATIRTLAAVAENGKHYPVLRHDQVVGLVGMNDTGAQAAIALRAMYVQQPNRSWKAEPQPPESMADPLTLLARLADPLESAPAGSVQPPRPPLPERATVFMLNAHWAFCDPLGHAIPNTAQALLNLVDDFKVNHRMVAMLTHYGWRVPQELQHQVTIFDEALPDEKQIEEMVKPLFESVKQPIPIATEMARIVDTVSGIPLYTAEQITAQALDGQGMHHDILWDLKTAQVESTRGVRIYRGGGGFKTLGGLTHLIEYGNRLVRGKRVPRLVLWLDEIEKAVAGFKGDLSGVSQDMVGHLLTWIVEVRALCVLLYGHPGTGKSAWAKAIGQEAGAVTLAADIGGMQGSLVGESQGYIRAFTKMAEAISRGQILIVATCNDVSALPSELMSRFADRFFIELPDRTEKDVIWPLKLKQFDLPAKSKLPDDTDWTGREIEQCCEKAWMWDTTLIEAATEVVPIAVTDPKSIEDRRNTANKAFKDASRPGLYDAYRSATPHKDGTTAATRGSRAIDVPQHIADAIFPPTKES